MEENIKKMNVMIVEDDDMTRKLLVIEFKRRGHNVLEYTDAARVMENMNREKPPVDAAVECRSTAVSPSYSTQP